MVSFNGFNSSSGKTTPIPGEFFSKLLPEINDPVELKVILWAFRCLDLQQGDLRYLTQADFLEADLFSGMKKEGLEKILETVIRRGVLLSANSGESTLFFLNSPRGRAALESLTRGAWKPEGKHAPQIGYAADRPNIFGLYEQNIGPLTPILADELRDAEGTYPEDWIKDAFKIAVIKNVRNWNYIEAILRSWKEKGRDERDQRTAKEDRKLNGEGEFSEFIRH